MTIMQKVRVQHMSKEQTKKACQVFNEKASASVLLIDSDGRKKPKFHIHQKTIIDKVSDLVSKHRVWQKLALALVTAFVVAVGYWGIMQ